jgi:F-type H+-transporting ATPase subunit b
MELIKPSIGLVFWMTVSFLILLFILKKFAWKPILNMLHEREQNIAEALNTAKKAREEMASLKADNERLLNEARLERDRMMKEARDTKDAIIAEAKGKAQSEANKILAQTRETIQTEKNAALTELKNQVASMSIQIAEKILRAELSNDDKQKALVQNMLKDINMN